MATRRKQIIDGFKTELGQTPDVGASNVHKRFKFLDELNDFHLFVLLPVVKVEKS